MQGNGQGQALHDKLCRGEALSDQEIADVQQQLAQKLKSRRRNRHDLKDCPRDRR